MGNELRGSSGTLKKRCGVSAVRDEYCLSLMRSWASAEAIRMGQEKTREGS